ncbi:DUF262 domain-containing protein [Oceanospirillum linum]|uniref:GmrSD restriction endonucleases N-terminal domain-containing protein n=1 Tax=Oceanospirillum linum TaxID=966 RepID=A0A1T1HAP1_OCELI|nr:DUF262 domain-containing protein [Oceanospirillum linum]OOV86882.1 hypothetical protein BTA35_0211335 [Oceanospirillum linum]SEG20028.1 Protein of unknown function DUF262 [Oleiphilus messinensis]SMP24349.1 Protein of unknown function DUF262 [Oceanospirillum linum]
MKLIDSIDIQPQTVKWLSDLHNKGLLVVDDSFQRNYVWTKKNQVQLIESILMGYPIPEIYLWNTGTDENSGDTCYSIVDGQQRTGAIFQYISNTFKLTDSSLNASNSCYQRVKNRYFKDLGTDDKKALWAYVFSVRIIRNSVLRDDIVTMFLRLNSNNMTLNPQELRNAEFDGEFMKVVSSLSELDFWSKNGIFGVSDRRRMRDISFVSTLLVFMKQGIQADIRNDNINKIYDLYNDEYPDKETDIERFEGVLRQVDVVIEGKRDRTLILKRQVHFYSLFTAVYESLIDDECLSSEALVNYRDFIDNYDNDGLLKEYFPDCADQIVTYKSLAKEGTRDKGNRLGRHEAIKQILKSKRH